MTTGPEHYVEAERLIELAGSSGRINDATRTALAAQAQVHATLALAGLDLVDLAIAVRKLCALDVSGVSTPPSSVTS